MKQVVGIFMCMVFVFIFVNITMAEESIMYGYDDYETRTIVDEWVKNTGKEEMEKYYYATFENGVYYTTGTLDNNEFKKVTGENFTENGLKNLYYNCEDYGYSWDIIDAKCEVIGNTNGYNVYIMNMKTEGKSLGTYNNEDYYEVSIIFMVHEY